jgi:hypothetical protein
MRLYTDQSGSRVAGVVVWSLSIGRFEIMWCRPAYLMVGHWGLGRSLRLGYGAYRGGYR